MARDIGLRLVVVVIRHEVFDGVFWEEILELGVQLGCQGLVVRHHQGRLLDLIDHRGDRVRLSGPGSPEQDLVAVAVLDSLNHLADGFRLVAGWFKWRMKLELHITSLDPLGSFRKAPPNR